MTTETSQPAFVKQLAANDRSIRDKALASLQTYLGGKRQLEEIEWLKLWKGLFYSMWMSDRPRTQQKLATDLASLVEQLSEENVPPFLTAFWKTVAREWNGIDVLRMEKFLFLVRKYVNASFQYLARNHWEQMANGRISDIFSRIPLHPSDVTIPNGLRLHVLDVYLDELEKVKLDCQEATYLPVEVLRRPLVALNRESPTKPIRLRAEAAVLDPRWDKWSAHNNGGNSVHAEVEEPSSTASKDDRSSQPLVANEVD